MGARQDLVEQGVPDEVDLGLPRSSFRKVRLLVFVRVGLLGADEGGRGSVKFARRYEERPAGARISYLEDARDGAEVPRAQ